MTPHSPLTHAKIAGLTVDPLVYRRCTYNEFQLGRSFFEASGVKQARVAGRSLNARSDTGGRTQQGSPPKFKQGTSTVAFAYAVTLVRSP